MPGWMQGEQYVHQMAGGHHLAANGAPGRAGDDGDDDGGGGYGSDHHAAARHHPRSKRVSSASTHSGSSVPLPHAALLAFQHASAAQHAGVPRRSSQGTSGPRGAATAPAPGANSGAVPLQQALALGAAQPGAPHMVEWRLQEGGGCMEVALVLGGDVFVGRLVSRGPLANWVPPAMLQQQQGPAPPAAQPAVPTFPVKEVRRAAPQPPPNMI
jgi:hypothetical protein